MLSVTIATTCTFDFCWWGDRTDFLHVFFFYPRAHNVFVYTRWACLIIRLLFRLPRHGRAHSRRCEVYLLCRIRLRPVAEVTIDVCHRGSNGIAIIPLWVINWRQVKCFKACLIHIHGSSERSCSARHLWPAGRDSATLPRRPQRRHPQDRPYAEKGLLQSVRGFLTTPGGPENTFPASTTAEIMTHKEEIMKSSSGIKVRIQSTQNTLNSYSSKLMLYHIMSQK